MTDETELALEPEEEEEVDLGGDLNEEVSIDFTQADVVPTGALLLAIIKITKVESKAGNKMLNLALAVMDGEGGQYNGRKIFDKIMLETDAVVYARPFFQAFLSKRPKGTFKFVPSELVGLQSWCLVVAEKGKGEYAGTTRARVKRYGIKAPAGGELAGL